MGEEQDGRENEIQPVDCLDKDEMMVLKIKDRFRIFAIYSAVSKNGPIFHSIVNTNTCTLSLVKIY